MDHALWQPDQHTIQHSHMHHFMRQVNTKYALALQHYDDLYQWSIDEKALFWETVAEFSGIIFSKPPSCIIEPHAEMRKTQWFINATLNFAENLLWRRDEHIALIYANAEGARAHITYAKLFAAVMHLAQQLTTFGLQPGDRVAGFVTNRIETVVAMLATTWLGAIWTACGTEFAASALIERFSQISPRLLFVVAENDTHHEIIKQLNAHLPSVEKTISLHDITLSPSNTPILIPPAFPFNHPLYILYSSGTTGKPKCIVHGAGNTLIQHKKELMLHTDLHPEDRLFFYTTCSWMMWHWMVSGLSVGATLMLYDGLPFNPTITMLFDLIDEYEISILGCGAKLIETYYKTNIKPHKTHALTQLKTILTTGSPLIKDGFEYIYRDVKPTVRVSSISGGSDIISCFALGNPLLPVYAEELQCRGLGMRVEIFNENGEPIQNQTGELVCTAPFPSMPLYFWNDPDDQRYFHAYFAQFPNVWTHGDYAKLTTHHGLIIYGRSDATLNPGGVRIGTADIYTHVLKIPDIVDCVAAGKQENGDERIILFVKLKTGVTLDATLQSAIKKAISDNTSPFHIPKKIVAVSDIPKTMNGKTMEIVVKNIINGRTVNHMETLMNPGCLEEFKNV